MISFIKAYKAPILIGTVFLSSGGTYYSIHRKKLRLLNHPVMKHALNIIHKDTRITNFCGDDLRTGLFIRQS